MPEGLDVEEAAQREPGRQIQRQIRQFVDGRFSGVQRRPISITADPVALLGQAVGGDAAAKPGADDDEIEIELRFRHKVPVRTRGFFHPHPVKFTPGHPIDYRSRTDYMRKLFRSKKRRRCSPKPGLVSLAMAH